MEPPYVLIESDKSTELINDDIYICLAEVEGKARSIKTPMKAVGGIYGVAGLLGIIDLATTGGIILPFNAWHGCNCCSWMGDLCLLTQYLNWVNIKI